MHKWITSCISWNLQLVSGSRRSNHCQEVILACLRIGQNNLIYHYLLCGEEASVCAVCDTLLTVIVFSLFAFVLFYSFHAGLLALLLVLWHSFCFCASLCMSESLTLFFLFYLVFGTLVNPGHCTIKSHQPN